MDFERWRQIEALYHSARVRPNAERAILLAKADPEIRAEVESLLSKDDLAIGFLESPGTASAAMAAGTQIGQYRLEARLGEGGMGTVYHALDTKLNRPVAIKFLSDELADVDARRRFQREAQTASSLNHPHIVTVHDVGEFQGRQYIVTEFVDGGTLKDWARAEKRTWHRFWNC